MSLALAVKYRPQSFTDLVEQDSVKTILLNQLESGEIKNAYLFCGPAGDGKTTTARIFANEINHGQGSPIEVDAASNNGVDEIRDIIVQARTVSLDSEYKVIILDEAHMITTQGWNAFLKTLEEPPAKTIFIMCTTDPQKIPKTILSRVQRFQFQRISQESICRRLELIYQTEAVENGWVADYKYGDGIEYIAKVADGGMRDAITMLDKCLAYSTELSIENVVKALGTVDYDEMFKLTNSLIGKDSKTVLGIIDNIYSQGKDLKVFIKNYSNFILDVCKYNVTGSYEFIQIPDIYPIKYADREKEYLIRLLDKLVSLCEKLRWETTPKPLVESTFMLECFREEV